MFFFTLDKSPKMVKKSKREVVPLGLQRVLTGLSRQVSALSPSAVLLFNSLYGNEQNKKVEKNRDAAGNSIKSILESSNDPLKRACALVELVDRITVGVQKSRENFDEFERSEEMKKKFEVYCQENLKTCLDACLLLKEALDNDIFPMEKVVKKRKIPREERVKGGAKEVEEVKIKKMQEHRMAEKMVQFFLGWDLDDLVSEKLPEFEEEPIKNIGLFQQLVGGIPVAPIADSILPFTLLEWQKEMFNALRSGQNVVVSAPTSSGKTMVALGYIVAFLQNELKSLLVYVVPNNVLALEVSAILNKYQDGRVSTYLDMEEDRRQDERVIVCTPAGAINSGLTDKVLPDSALLVVDEVHAIANEGGAEMEKCLREFSSVQTLLLSATMTDETVEKLSDCLMNTRNTVQINERTQFMVSQDMVPRVMEDGLHLVPMNPLGAVTVEELKDDDLDLSLTPRDVLSLFVRIVKIFGIGRVPEYLAPIRFFCLHQCNIPDKLKTLEDIEDEEEEDEGIIRRLTMTDIGKWQRSILDFLVNPPSQLRMDDWDEKVERIMASFRMSLTDESTAQFSAESAFNVVEEMKKKDMFPALFFFPNLYGAVQMASQIVRYLSMKECGSGKKEERAKKSKVRALEKQISSLERAKGNGRELRERRQKMEEQLEREVHSEMIAVPPEQCLSENGGIPPESFNELVAILKRWNKNFTQSHTLAQMVLHGIGVLSGDMPLELQVYIRHLFSSGVISLLMTTSDCAYGINTPTKTVVLANGSNEANRRQMKGRAGRKGLGFKAFSVSFRCGVEEARQHLKPLVGEHIEVYGLDENLSHWITDVEQKEINLDLEEEFYGTAYLRFGMGAVMAPKILEEALVETKGDTNRPLRILLSLLPCTPHNSPCRRRVDWSFTLPDGVNKLYEEYGIDSYPNVIVYEWMMNQRTNLTGEEKEELVKNAKNWAYLIYLLKSFFREKSLYEAIRDLITGCVISTATSLE